MEISIYQNKNKDHFNCTNTDFKLLNVPSIMALKKNSKNKTYDRIKKNKDELQTAFASQALRSDIIYTLDDYPDRWALFMKVRSWPAQDNTANERIKFFLTTVTPLLVIYNPTAETDT